MFDLAHPAASDWRAFGRSLLKHHESGDVKGLVAISAHWESEQQGVIQVNTDERNPLVYDYYGFPNYYVSYLSLDWLVKAPTDTPLFIRCSKYDVTFSSTNPFSFSDLVLSSINASIKTSKPDASISIAKPVSRGLDHGVFVPLRIAFASDSIFTRSPPLSEVDISRESSSIPSTLPICQITLPTSSSSPLSSLHLGALLRSLRAQGIAIFANGEGVHNLRDLRNWLSISADRVTGERKMGLKSGAEGYTTRFLEALTEAVTLPASALVSKDTDAADPRWKAAESLFSHPDYRSAHPTPEHLLPVLVAVGATLPHEQLYESMSLPQGSLGYNMFSTEKLDTAVHA